jgi:hypothetical protein
MDSTTTVAPISIHDRHDYEGNVGQQDRGHSSSWSFKIIADLANGAGTIPNLSPIPTDFGN